MVKLPKITKINEKQLKIVTAVLRDSNTKNQACRHVYRLFQCYVTEYGNNPLYRSVWGGSAARSGKGIFKAPAARYTVFKEFAVDMPVVTHQRTASETRSLMIIADLPTVWLNGCLKSIFNTHMIYIDSSGVCFGLNAPVGTHFLYGRVCSACMISTFFAWESNRFFHEESIAWIRNTINTYWQKNKKVPMCVDENLGVLYTILRQK